MSKTLFSHRLLAVACGLVTATAQAQSIEGADREIVVTGQALGREGSLSGLQSLSGTALRERGQASLGETLSGLPGVSSTGFGTLASRPIVRGLDAERLRVLGNGSASHDVSALSEDHAVPVDALSIERIELLRGPAALLYGPSALGGVVNVLDNRIPREALTALQGRVQLQGATGNHEGSMAALLEGGNGAQAWHVDGFERNSGDVRVPNAAGRIPNADSNTRGGAVGWGHWGETSRLGLSLGTWRSDYGSVADADARIGMRSDRLALEGEWRQPWAGWQSLKLQGGATDYGHTEYDKGVPGTVFAKQAQDLRLEARHQPLGPLEGVWGLQWEDARLQVDGAEAFMPHSQTHRRALFALETWRTRWGGLQAGARLEQVSVRSLGSPTTGLFVPAARDFQPHSVSLAADHWLAGDWQAIAQVGHSERAPSDAELFADGPHLATQTWTRGNPALGPEKSSSVELGLERRTGLHPVRLSVYDSRFSNFIGLMAVPGSFKGDPALPEYVYAAVPARIRGWEASGQSRVWQGTGTLDLLWRADRVLGDNLGTGEALPRIAPWRAGLSAVYRLGDWQARMGFDHAAAQCRVPAGSVCTAAYTLWNANVDYRYKSTMGTVHWFARLDNLTDALAYSASAILTSTQPGRVPLPGRTLRLGMQWLF